MSLTRLQLNSEEETNQLAQRLSLWARPGLLIALKGELGSGKSTFARAFIRALLPKGLEIDIPSPSFSLLNSYTETRVPVVHADLYRMKDVRQELGDIGLDELLQTHIGLVEWADRAPQALWQNTLTLHFSGRGSSRDVEMKAEGPWEQILARDALIAGFVADSRFEVSSRTFFEGDASSRRYETVQDRAGQFAILMDMPQRPDGPPVKNGKPYSAIAHLAEGITAVVAINRYLHGLGYSAPDTLQVDLKQGLALIEPLGSQVFQNMTRAGEDMRLPLETAAEVLVDMASRSWPVAPEAAPGVTHPLSRYDEEALLIEVDLLPSWFVPHVRGAQDTSALSESFARLWAPLVRLVQPQNPVWTLRDYHSPNLLWLPAREGLRRVGLIDTQDAVLGHPAYDLVSMIQDARVDVPDELQDHLYEHYVGLRRKQSGFDEAEFAQSFAILGAQRASKILGIFARLNARDGKPAYLQHMPRVSRALAHNLRHPILADLKKWFETHVPEAISMGQQ